jgi:hypothetical protein
MVQLALLQQPGGYPTGATPLHTGTPLKSVNLLPMMLCLAC